MDEQELIIGKIYHNHGRMDCKVKVVDVFTDPCGTKAVKLELLEECDIDFAYNEDGTADFFYYGEVGQMTLVE